MKFTDILDKRIDEFERPELPPIGHYVWQITKHPEVDAFEANGTKYTRVTFQCKALAAHEDVDEDDLAAFGNIVGFPSRKTFLMSESEDDERNAEQTLFQLRQFLENSGVEGGISLGEAFAACVNGQFLGEFAHRPDKNNPEILYGEIKRTTAV